MDEITTELIAIGASVTANCVACFHFHEKKAREAVGSFQQVGERLLEGLGVAQAVAVHQHDQAQLGIGRRVGLQVDRLDVEQRVFDRDREHVAADDLREPRWSHRVSWPERKRSWSILVSTCCGPRTRRSLGNL